MAVTQAHVLSKGREALRGILKASRGIDERRLDPFHLDVKTALATAGQYFSYWSDADDLLLDVKTLNSLSRVLQVQEARLRYEAGLFLADPKGFVKKLGRLSLRTLANAFLSSWHPVAELEQVTGAALQRFFSYWMAMPPWWGLRKRETIGPPSQPSRYSEEEMAALGIFSKEGFLRFLGDLWSELRGCGEVEYWKFVGNRPFPEVVGRAYGTSFLVTYGYCDMMEVDGEVRLIPQEERKSRESSRSFAIVLGGEE